MDCIYQHMSIYNYLIFIDVDEFIIPEKHNNLKLLFKYLESLQIYNKTASFSFEEACFERKYKSFPVNNQTMRLMSQSTRRGPHTAANTHKAMKSIIRPQFVKNMHIHRVAGREATIAGYKYISYVNYTEAKLHHYKNATRCLPYNVTDKSIMRFKTTLLNNIKKAITVINIQ